jgi:hypothetical protein
MRSCTPHVSPIKQALAALVTPSRGLKYGPILLLVASIHLGWHSAANSAEIGDAAALIEHDFVGARKCKSCHGKELMGDQHSTWLAGPHHRGFEILKGPDALAVGEVLRLKAAPAESPECLICHVTAYGIPETRIREPLTQADGVQCESCHGPGRDFRKKKIMSNLKRARAKGLWDPANDHGICLRCHNSQSPTHDPQRYTLADGSTTDFDYEQAMGEILHPIPEHVKGHYIELRAKEKAEEKRLKKLRAEQKD